MQGEGGGGSGSGSGSENGRSDNNDIPLLQAPPRPLLIHPPLFNSANPWATTLEHLRSLYACEATGAVTTRTSLLDEEGFPHDDGVHRYAFFDAGSHGNCLLNDIAGEEDRESGGRREKNRDASVNNLGYSPIPLDQYLDFIRTIDGETKSVGKKEKKTFIVSVTGTPDEMAECYRRIVRCQFGDLRSGEGGVGVPLAMEVNLSCPNIPGKPPPAYEGDALKSYITRIAEMAREVEREYSTAAESRAEVYGIPWGVKTPPYTHAGQFETLVSVLRDSAVPTITDPPFAFSASSGSSRNSNRSGEGESTMKMMCPISFVTATNTLGTCLLLEGRRDEDGVSGGSPGLSQVLPGLGIGGMAGAPLHPLALGNVATLRWMLDEQPETAHVIVLGIGGVGDSEGYKRMRSVGAAAVGVGTALGIKGLDVFKDIERGLAGVWDD
ncbi:FMN-linked oxidoreductase [Xylariaceae sp. FL0594]|nr:FMN-linked oxidoreductase [Xylariaceae sp. FL0594]